MAGFGSRMKCLLPLAMSCVTAIANFISCGSFPLLVLLFRLISLLGSLRCQSWCKCQAVRMKLNASYLFQSLRRRAESCRSFLYRSRLLLRPSEGPMLPFISRRIAVGIRGLRYLVSFKGGVGFCLRRPADGDVANVLPLKSFVWIHHRRAL